MILSLRNFLPIIFTHEHGVSRILKFSRGWREMISLFLTHVLHVFVSAIVKDSISTQDFNTCPLFYISLCPPARPSFLYNSIVRNSIPVPK